MKELFVVSVFLLGVWAQSSATQQLNSPLCFKLTGTRSCGDYASYWILRTDKYNNVASFDSWVSTNGLLNADANCGLGNATARYSNSLSCSYAVIGSSNGTVGKSCNMGTVQQGAPGQPATAVCQYSINTALNSLVDAMNKKCPTQSLPANLVAFSSNASNSNCLLGVGADAQRKCGFPNSADGEAFCKLTTNAKDLCCIAANNKIASNETGTSPALATVGPIPSTSLPSTTLTELAPTDSSVPSASTPPSSSGSSPGAVSPIIIGAGALGVALIAVLASVLFFMTRKGTLKHTGTEESGDDGSRPMSPKPKAIPQSAPVSSKFADNMPPETLECIFEYKANLFDELTIAVGDAVQVAKKYDDGWAFGYNLNTQKEGTFPFACLGNPGDRDSRFDSELRDSSALGDSRMYDSYYSKRASSMFDDLAGKQY
ncbi:hypothetical protein HDV03_001235 [Kappamyces sp. JEL0829]|nr:hypothetical protein HDV03_001235 [Kappamyces sp. JEL0829]